MTSDDERREVAKRMREYDVVEFRESAIVPFLECLGHGYVGWRGILDELADLIDRPTCKTIEHEGPDEFHVCKSCSRCSYGWFEDTHDKPYSYCPNCGAMVTEEDGRNVRKL